MAQRILHIGGVPPVLIAGTCMQSRKEVKTMDLAPMDSCTSTCNPLHTGESEMSALANSDDPDQMPHNAAFHLGLHCLLRQKRSG